MSVRSLLSRPLAFTLQAAVLATLIGGATAFAFTEKTVTVLVDGSPRSVTTHGGTVADALLAAHLTAGPHDLLAPPADAALGDGDRVALRRGRLLTLLVDGVRRTLWVTATSVDEALGEIGLRAGGLLLSASRSRQIPLGGLSLEIVTPKLVAILVDGRVKVLTTTGPTVGDALREADVTVSPSDQLSPASDVLLTDHMTVTVTRIVGRSVTESVPIAFSTQRQPTLSLYEGETSVLVAGRPGVLLRSYALRFVDGRLVARQLTGERETAAPVTELLAVGTMPRPAVQRSAGSGDGLNWGALAQCESGGNPRAVSSNGAYRGLYQFSFQTWRGVGGTGDPIEAAPAEQTHRAQILYARSGRSPWPVCGRYL